MDVPPPSGTPFRLGRGGGASAPRPTRHSACHWPWASYPWEKVKLRAKSRQREEDRRCESFGIRVGTADGEGVWNRPIEVGDSEQTAQDRTTATRRGRSAADPRRA